MINTIEERTRKVVAGALRAARQKARAKQARDIEMVTDPGAVDW